MSLPTNVLQQILTSSGFIKEKDFQECNKNAQQLHKPITDILIFRGLIGEEQLGQLIAEHFKTPFIRLKNKIIPLEILQLVPENLAQKYRLVPFQKKDNDLYLAMENPQDLEAIELIKRKTSLNIIPHYTTSTNISKGLGQYKKNIKQEFNNIINDNIKKSGKTNKEDIAKAALDLPVIKILETILEYAYAEQASDIHIEALVDELIIRFRIDGILRDIVSLPKELQPAIIARIKILSQLKIDEHRIPQDGRFKFQIGAEYIAFRVSILPAFYGENAVLRLLLESSRPLSFEELGLMGENLKELRNQIQKPNGMILVTGPTGSGKTTTLYSILNTLNTIDVKLCTIEDPIEYGIRRVNQTQVNTATGLTFASGLRSLLRHDPDIIMVGEIRDNETAEIAIHSALTGHLVLSTLHTNDAPSSIPRFIDMGAEPFLIASTINIVIAQRLVRKICQRCITEYQPDKSLLKFFAAKKIIKNPGQKYYKGKGCEECGYTGYKGRIGLFEIFKMTPKLRALTLKKASADEIRKVAIEEGMTSMIDDGINKVAAGITTLEEILHAVKE